MTRVNQEALLRHLHVQPGESIRPSLINRDLLRMYGDGYYENIDYTVLTDSKRNVLRVMPLEKRWGPDYLRFGINLQADSSQGSAFGLRAAYHQTWLNALGGELLYGAEIGSNNRLGVNYYQPLDVRQRFFFEGLVEGSQHRLNVYDNDHRIAQYKVSESRLAGWLGANVGLLGQVKLGWVQRHPFFHLDVGDPSLPDADANFGGWKAMLDFDQFDRMYFPTRGWASRIAYFDSPKRDYSRADVFHIVQHTGVGAAGHDGRVGVGIGAAFPEFIGQLGFQRIFGHAGSAGAHGAGVAGAGDVRRPLLDAGFGVVLDQPHGIEFGAQIVHAAWRAFAGTALGAYVVQGCGDALVPVGIVAEGMPEAVTVDQQFRQFSGELFDRVGGVKAKSGLGGFRAVAVAVPDFAFFVLFAAEENGFRFVAANQHQDFIQQVASRNQGQPEFLQAVTEVIESLWPYISQHSKYAEHGLLDRLVEPERVIMFRVSWVDDHGEVQVNRGLSPVEAPAMAR